MVWGVPYCNDTRFSRACTLQRRNEMRALMVIPKQAASLELATLPEPQRSNDELLVDTVALGVCGTDREIVHGVYGESPEGRQRLIVGHESLGRVRIAPVSSGFQVGQLVVGIVRQPDPVPCDSCRTGEWDMCENGKFTEHGIKQRDGFGAERFVLDPNFAIAVSEELGIYGVLLEPASIVAKAWEQIERITTRAVFRPRQVLVTGAGPIGLLSALFCAQRNLELHVFDRTQRGAKPELVRALGGEYHSTDLSALRGAIDVVIECTGDPRLVIDALGCTGPNGVICLTGISSGARSVQLAAGRLNDELVLENRVIFGTVNANRRHYIAAEAALRHAPAEWLKQLITRRVPLTEYASAFERRRGEIKNIIEFATGP